MRDLEVQIGHFVLHSFLEDWSGLQKGVFPPEVEVLGGVFEGLRAQGNLGRELGDVVTIGLEGGGLILHDVCGPEGGSLGDDDQKN